MWAHDNFCASCVLSFILVNEGGDIDVGRYHNVMVAVVLHNLKDLNLMGSEASAIAVDEIPEEIH